MKVIKGIAYILRFVKFKCFYKKATFSKFIHFPENLILRGNVLFKGNASLSQGDYLGTTNSGKIILGDSVYLGRDCKFVSQELIEVGENTIFGPNVIIYDHDHKIEDGKILHTEFNSAPVIIGKDCWIGAGAIILKGTQIGDGTVIGAGTVVKGVIPAKSVVYNQQNIVVKNL